MKLLFYGCLASIIGREVHIEGTTSCTIDQLRRKLFADYPHAQEAFGNRRVRACVADMLVDDDYVLAATDTVEFLPPVSGG